MFDDLNPQQAAAVDHQGSPLLIVAGAGTGKTRTLAARVARILADGADPSRILLLTFTRRAAAEMVARAKARAAEESNGRRHGDVVAGTFHAVANRLLRHYSAAAGLSANFTVLDAADSKDLFGMVRTAEGMGERGKRFPRAETVAGIYSRLVNSQAHLSDVLDVDYPWCADHAEDLKTIFNSYTAHKRSNSVLDFDDLLLFWRGITASAVGEHLRNDFDHILIDEYQDTNPIQNDIIRGMCRPDTDLCAVGDDAQAIYGFRSATVANMWAFTEHFPGAEVVTLEQNYRSTSPILAFANRVLSDGLPSDDRPFVKTLWGNKPEGTRPTLATCWDERAQSELVADSILDARERGMDLRDQAVLFRAGHHSEGLELELHRRDIPYVKYGGLKYLETAHVKDLMSLLRILDNPDDALAWHRVLKSMEGVGPATSRRLEAELGIADETSDALNHLLDGLGRFPSPAKTQADELRAALSDCREIQAPAEQIDRLLGFCELTFPNNYDNPLPRLADLGQLGATASAYSNRSRFLAEVTLDPPGKTSDLAQEPYLDDDWLTLSTIHSAKGMEWRNVYLLHAADGNLPSDMALGDAEGLAEELRLTYVALTRAKDELTVSFPMRFHVNRFATDDRHVYAQLSRFIEVGRDLCNEVTTGTNEQSPLSAPNQTINLTHEVDNMLAGLWD